MLEFIQMGGYAVYVWSSFGIAFLVLLWSVVSPLLQHRTILKKGEDYHGV